MQGGLFEILLIILTPLMFLCRVLLETREMLEEQLQRARKRADHVLELESEIIKYKQQLNDFTLEREANHEKLQELFEENAQLQLLTKSAVNDNSTFDVESDSTEDFDGGVLLR
jgi:L-fucose isomerase-like protein